MKAINFLEWFTAWDMEACEHTNYECYVNELGKVSVFYLTPFKPEMITELFEGWAEWFAEDKDFSYRSSECFVIQGLNDWEKISMYDELSNASMSTNMPKTLNDLISDCQRAGIELTFKPEIVERYFKSAGK